MNGNMWSLSQTLQSPAGSNSTDYGRKVRLRPLLLVFLLRHACMSCTCHDNVQYAHMGVVDKYCLPFLEHDDRFIAIMRAHDEPDQDLRMRGRWWRQRRGTSWW